MPATDLVLQISCTFDYLTRSTANIVYNYCLVCFGFLLPVFLIVVCYTGILRAVRKNVKEMQHLNQAHADEANSSADQKRRLQQKQVFKQEVKLAKVRLPAKPMRCN